MKLFLEILVKLIAPILAGLWARQGVKLEQAEKERDDAKQEAQAWADRPRNDDDVVKRLRSAASERKLPRI